MNGTMSRFRTYGHGTIAAAVWLGIAITQTVGAQNAAGPGDKVGAVISEQVKAEQAAQASQKLALESAYQVQKQRGWGSISSLTARKVEGDPFWKAVRPSGVPQKAKLNQDIVTSQFYTTCFTGVVVPYVCTTGSTVCGN